MALVDLPQGLEEAVTDALQGRHGAAISVLTIRETQEGLRVCYQVGVGAERAFRVSTFERL